MDKQKPAAYTGRFGDATQTNKVRASDAHRATPRRPESVRRPSGFGTVGQSSRVKPTAKPESEKKHSLRLKLFKSDGKKSDEPNRPSKRERIVRESEPGKNRPVLRALAALVAVLVVMLAILLIVFGGDDKTYHQMPVIERESIAQFEPEATPAADMENL